MKGSPKIIELLNNALTKELTAINQYFIHSKMCENWGYLALAKKYYDESLGEMKHAEELIKRILFLEGTPNMTRYDKIKIGDTVKKQLESDLQIELNAIEELKPGIKLCLDELDHATRFWNALPRSVEYCPGQIIACCNNANWQPDRWPVSLCLSI